MHTEAQQDAKPSSIRVWAQAAITFILWIINLGLGFVALGFSRDIFLAVYARFSTEAGPAVAFINLLTFPMVILFIGYVIGTGEYHRKNFGKHGSWTLFAWTFTIELLLIILYFVI